MPRSRKSKVESRRPVCRQRLLAGLQRSVPRRGQPEVPGPVQRQSAFHLRVPEGHAERGSRETCPRPRRHREVPCRQRGQEDHRRAW